MSSESPAADAHVRRFWAEYDALLKAYRVPAKAIPWYRRRVEGYIEAPPDRRLRDHTPDDLETSLNDMGRDARLSDSQFRQIVDALRLLFQKVLAVPWSAVRLAALERRQQGARCRSPDGGTDLREDAGTRREGEKGAGACRSAP